MTRRLTHAAPFLVALALLAGCGGFGNKNPEVISKPIRNYVALGDGFAAGPYVGRTTDPNCLRSVDDYPAQVAKALKVVKLTDVSCTGADTRALTNKSKASATKKKLPAQLSAVNRETDLVTLGIGLEDRGLLTTMFNICVNLPCGSRVSPGPIRTQLGLFGDTVTSAVRAIQDKAPNAYIVLVGYPSFTPTDNRCSKIPRISAAELDIATKVIDEVNSAIRSAALQTGASYVDVASISTNHELCSDEPWVSGKTAKKGKSRAYHPLAAEQKAVAEAVATQVRGR